LSYDDMVDIHAKATDSLKKAVGTTTTPAETASSAVYFKSVYMTVMLANHSKTTCEIDLYNASAKRDGL